MVEQRSTEASDREWLARLQEGDAGAFDALFARHRRALLAYVQAILRDRALAEDIVQDSFLELARQAAVLDPARGVAGWLYRVARNRAIDLQRHRKFEAQPGDAEVVAERDRTEWRASAADDAIRREEAGRLELALRRLPEGEREVLVLRYFAERTFREIAQIVGRPIGTVLWQANRGVARLRKVEDWETGILRGTQE